MNTGAVDLDARTAAVIAAGMRRVATADGEALHPNELSLIEDFEKDIPPGTQPTATIGDAAIRSIYLKSLVMVALADGRISEEEKDVIMDLAQSVGADRGDVDQATEDVKREFISIFKGVTHFRDQVETLAAELGISLD
ncbi:MAG: hypothetical protein H6736_19085 [Alphaproteobacteria bacterium]|nr:hypothetical protein [Alphaproteobacteria bacterium]MCB9693920.1 hypothetical protein [Alphaproteobacteria bacterium]